jgi:hypothetical protein
MTTTNMTFGGTVSATTFTGNLTGNATNITATSNSTLTSAPNLNVSAAKITGVLDVGKGGTGANLAINGFNNLSPCITDGDISYYRSASGGNVSLSSLNNGNKYLRLDFSDPNPFPYWESNPGDLIFGDGSDGTVTISSNTTLTSDMYYENLTVNLGVTVTTAGFRIFVRNTLTLVGSIVNNGSNAVGQSAGAGAPAGSLTGGSNGTPGGGAGGVAAAATLNLINSLGGAGGKGGGTTGNAGTPTAPTNINGGTKILRGFPSSITGRDLSSQPINGGVGGSGGQGGSTGVGGGGGGGGGVIIVACRNFVSGGSIIADGGNGGNGTSANGNGGGGGGGGVVVFSCLSAPAGGPSISAGGGGGGSGNGTGVAGANGIPGNIYRYI